MKDLIMKLVRLANNNPNDNEANLAARKVCKLLEENNFKLINGSSTPPGYWKDVQRSDDPLRATPWTWGEVNSIFDAINKEREQQRRYEEKMKAQHEYYTSPKPDYVWDPVRNDWVRKPKPKRPLKCSRCGVEQEYVCHGCVWDDIKSKV
jgi:hypothetical protein